MGVCLGPVSLSISLPGAAVAAVSLPGMFPGLGDVDALWLFEPALSTVLLAAVMMSCEEGKIRIMLD